MIPFVLFFSCDSTKESNLFSDTSENAPSHEQDVITEPNEVDPSSLNGIPPQESLTLIDFQAINFDGTPRTKNDLLGTPTVMWFFPAADTPG